MNNEDKILFERIKSKYKTTWLDDEDVNFLINMIDSLSEINKKLREDNAIFALEGSRVALKQYIDDNYILKKDLQIKDIPPEPQLSTKNNMRKFFKEIFKSKKR